MKKAIRRIVFLVSLFLVYLVVKEAISFFDSAFGLGPKVGWAAVVSVSLIFVIFILVPSVRLLFLRKLEQPARTSTREEQVIRKRLRAYASNPYLKRAGYIDDTNKSLRERYGDATAILKSECDRIRGSHVRSLFLSSVISQNGFIDAILILSHSIRVIKETFILYAGRVAFRDMLSIGRRIYYSVAVGGSEGVEYVAAELMTSLAPGLIKSIPFLGKATESLSDGLVNAVLLTRVSLITENYCTLTLVEKPLRCTPKVVDI